MIDTVSEKAFAKLNLSLDVSRPRGDGYHDMVMIMQSISLFDDISVKITDDDNVSARTSFSYLPSDDRNLGVKAAKKFFAAAELKHGALIDMKKRIPVGAGMAGGSSDAAAVLRVLNRYFDHILSDDALLKVAETVGSDVPYCLIGGTALAEGRGEKLTPIMDIPDCEIVVCKPSFSISTPELFAAIDRIKLRTHPDTEGLISSIEAGELESMCRRMYNVFEDVPDRRLRVVSEIKSLFLSSGALGSIMTGTGSAVFGIFSPGTDTSVLVEELKKQYGFCVNAKPVGYLL